MKKRISAAFLLLALLLNFSACGTQNEDTETSANTPEQTTAETEVVEKELYEKIDLDNSTVRVRYFGNADYEKYDVLGEDGGEVLADAVYKRNLTVEENFNMKFEWIKGSGDWLGYPAEMEALILSGNDAFDIGFMELSKCLPQSAMGYYKDMMNSKAIDINDPWWYSDLIRNTQVNDLHMYYITGAFSLTTMLKAGSVFFNKDIWKANFGDTEKLYDMVRNETWTLDVMKQYSANVYKDVNGDGKLDGGDIYGYCNDGSNTIKYWSTCSGLSYSSRNEKGEPVLNMYNEDILKMVDLLYDMTWGANICYINDGTITGVSAFKNQNALFYNKFLLHTMTQLRDTEFEWGVLPYPALYEKSGYANGASTVSGQCAFIPNTSAAIEMDSLLAVLNGLSAEAHVNVVPVCETALRFKNSSDPSDAEMINIIYNSLDAQFIHAANIALNELGSIFELCVFGHKYNSGGYTSFWKANEAAYQALLDTLIQNAK